VRRLYIHTHIPIPIPIHIHIVYIHLYTYPLTSCRLLVEEACAVAGRRGGGRPRILAANTPVTSTHSITTTRHKDTVDFIVVGGS
jgi:hypothetical protein